MGFFNKLKQNFNHGGVKVTVSAPDTVSLNDANFTANVTITNTSDTPQTIKSLKVALVEDFSRPQAGDPMTRSADGQVRKEISSNTYNESFALQPNESKQMPLQVPLNFGKNAAGMTDNAALQTAAKVLGGLQSVMDATNGGGNYRYYVQAVADVDGISFDPSASADIQVLRPGEVGGSMHIKL